MTILNRQIHLVSRPAGEPSADNFKLVEVPVEALAEGEVLVRNHYLSLDPYMRGRMNESKSYATTAAAERRDDWRHGGRGGGLPQ